MTATMLPEPVRTRVPDDPDVVHVVCRIHVDDAYCGARFTSGKAGLLPDDTETTCPMCADADERGVTCVRPGCPGQYGLAWLWWRLTGRRP